MGPVGVGSTFLATALGRTPRPAYKHSVVFERADRLLTTPRWPPGDIADL